MDKKRLLELAGIRLTETTESVLLENAVKVVTDWYLELSKTTYKELAELGELPSTEQGYIEIMKDTINDNISILVEEVRNNLDKELPSILKTLRRQQIGRKRQRRI